MAVAVVVATDPNWRPPPGGGGGAAAGPVGGHDPDVLYAKTVLPWPNPFGGTQHDDIFTGRHPGTAPAATDLVLSPTGDDGADSILLPPTDTAAATWPVDR